MSNINSTLTSGPSAVISGDILTQGIKIATALQCDLLIFILRIIRYLKEEILFMPSSMHHNKLHEAFKL